MSKLSQLFPFRGGEKSKATSNSVMLIHQNLDKKLLLILEYKIPKIHVPMILDNVYLVFLLLSTNRIIAGIKQLQLYTFL